MADRVIAKTDLRQWLASLAADYDVVAPVGREAGPAAWKDINAAQDIDIGISQMVMAAKEYLLPPYEPLFRYHGKKGEDEERLESGIQHPTPDTRHPTLMIGLRLCDAQAIAVLDSVYLEGPFRDPYYAERREKLVLMAAVCDDPRWSCFCNSVGNLDEWAKGLDALITDLGDKIYVSPLTETGKKLVQGTFFADPTEEESKRKSEVWTKLAAAPKRPFAGKDLSQLLSWEDPIWQEMARKCLGCGVCSYLCPTCSCFDIQDEVTGGIVERYRCRDTCQFSDFTQMGAGHNPRPEKTMRVRQRIMHKFKYQMEQFQLVGCTGCGRCVENCPVNIDIRTILTRIVGEAV
jgi:ferredoxin